MPPDKGAYLRRKSSEKLRKRQVLSRSLTNALRVGSRLLLAAAALGLVLWCYRFASSSARFDLRTIKCEGCVQTQQNEIEAIIRKDFPRNILRINLEQLRRRLERERWIKGVQIRRILPSDLIIYVEERVPAAIAEIGGELILTDEEGVFLDRYGPLYGRLDLPVFSGLLGDSASDYDAHLKENAGRIQLGLRVLAELNAGAGEYAHRISEVDLSDSGNVRLLLLDDTTEFYLGDRDFLKRFQLFLANISQYRDLKEEYTDIASVDLRFEGKIIYRPRNLAEASPAASREARP